MKKSKRLFIFLVLVSVVFYSSTVSLAHHGEHNNGHHNNNYTAHNYYCYGHATHAHPNGVCPYSSHCTATQTKCYKASTVKKSRKNFFPADITVEKQMASMTQFLLATTML